MGISAHCLGCRSLSKEGQAANPSFVSGVVIMLAISSSPMRPK